MCTRTSHQVKSPIRNPKKANLINQWLQKLKCAQGHHIESRTQYPITTNDPHNSTGTEAEVSTRTSYRVRNQDLISMPWAMAWHAMARHGTRWHAMAWHGTPRHAMAWHAVPCHGMPWHAMACNGMPGHAMSRCMPFNIFGRATIKEIDPLLISA